MKVLIVDDEKYIRELFSDILEMQGIEFETAKTGTESLKILEEEKDIGIVFLDYSLPDTNGLEISKKIKNINKDIKIFLLTGWNKDKFKNKDLSNIDEFISKPFDINKINRIFEGYNG